MAVISRYFVFTLFSLIHVRFVWFPNMRSAFAICFVERINLVISSLSPLAVLVFLVFLSLWADIACLTACSLPCCEWL